IRKREQMESIQPASDQIPGTVKDRGWASVLLVCTSLSLAHWFSLPGAFSWVAGLLFLVQRAFIPVSEPVRQPFGSATRTTLLRSVVVLPLVAWAPVLSSADTASLWVYAIACLVALVLDGADGKVARATNSHSEFGARFDMELDALFILGLCLAV